MFLKNLNPVRRIRELVEELGRTRRQREQAGKENEHLKEENQQLQTEIQHLQKEKQRLEKENQRLREDLEAARRAAQRQAAPFSRGKPKPNPQTSRA